jgi:hypothetical protein
MWVNKIKQKRDAAPVLKLSPSTASVSAQRDDRYSDPFLLLPLSAVYQMMCVSRPPRTTGRQSLGRGSYVFQSCCRPRSGD